MASAVDVAGLVAADAGRLALGTVQFGLDYGVSNLDGQTPPDEAARILEAAWQGGVKLVDTAHHYGNAEAVLGQVMRQPFRLISKTPQFRRAITSDEQAAVTAACRQSCRLLSVTTLDGLLVHLPQDLLGPGGDNLWRTLEDLRAADCTRRIGVSVYTPEEAITLLQRYPLQIIQLPLNALDQRFAATGALAQLHAAGVEIHVRSAFLQGLLTLPPQQLAPWFAPLLPYVQNFQRTAAALGRSPIGAALGYVLGFPEVAAVVCGVNTAAQWRELLREARAESPAEFADVGGADPFYLIPANWPPRQTQ